MIKTLNLGYAISFMLFPATTVILAQPSKDSLDIITNKVVTIIAGSSTIIDDFSPGSIPPLSGTQIRIYSNKEWSLRAEIDSATNSSVWLWNLGGGSPGPEGPPGPTGADGSALFFPLTDLAVDLSYDTPNTYRSAMFYDASAKVHGITFNNSWGFDITGAVSNKGKPFLPEYVENPTWRVEVDVEVTSSFLAGGVTNGRAFNARNILRCGTPPIAKSFSAIGNYNAYVTGDNSVQSWDQLTVVANIQDNGSGGFELRFDHSVKYLIYGLSSESRADDQCQMSLVIKGLKVY